MSWELDRTEYKECPCGQGKIKVESYSDDWGRYESRYTIECDLCKENYHIETASSYKPYRGDATFLVKNGETALFYAHASSYEEELVHTFSKEELEELYSELCRVSSAQKANRFLVKRHKSWYKTVKITEIREHTKEALERYDSYEYNKRKIAEKNAECRKVQKFYI